MSSITTQFHKKTRYRRSSLRWGITIAPIGFANLVGELAVTPTALTLARLDSSSGNPIVNQNLWALDFRTGCAGVNTDALYFTAGINNQQDGLFGEIVSVRNRQRCLPSAPH